MKNILGKIVFIFFLLIAIYVGGWLMFALPIYTMWNAAFDKVFTWQMGVIGFLKLIFAPFIFLLLVSLGAMLKCAFMDEVDLNV